MADPYNHMHVGIIGAGYVGLITGVCLADNDNYITLVEIDQTKVDMINQSVPHIYEEGLAELLTYNQQRLTATTDFAELSKTDVIFICVGTPSTAEGDINLKYVKEAAIAIGKQLEKKWKVVVVKSTVIPGTTERVVRPLVEQSAGTAEVNFGIAVNPEFLREGKAISDFQQPDRIVIGVNDKRSQQVLCNLFEPYDAPLMVTTPTAAETIKYASNALLATKISYANEIGNFCKKVGVDVYDVMKGVGMDHRIAPFFLNAGVGFGGSCFPKDIRALIAAGTNLNQPMELLKAVIEVNRKQPLRMIELLEKHVADLKNVRVAVLGLAFKAETDDVRESRAISVIEALQNKSADVVAYDPLANHNMRQFFPNICYVDSAREALENAEGCLIMTDWKEFQNLDFKSMSRQVVIDGRRMISPAKQKKLIYEGICW